MGETDHGWAQQSSRYSERERRRPFRRDSLFGDGSMMPALGLGTIAGTMERQRRRGKGNNLPRKRISALETVTATSGGDNPPIEEKMFAFESMPSSSQKANPVPLKILMKEERLKEVKPRRSSPGVIARLMGLDALPIPEPMLKQKKESTALPQKTSSVGFKEKLVSREDHSFRLTSKDQEEFKDVFEVLETSKVKKFKNPPIQKGLPQPRKDDKEVNYIMKLFLGARHSADEKHQKYVGLSDPLEGLDSNRDLFLKFLEEPNSLFIKHFKDLHSVPSHPQARHSTTPKLSKSKNSECSEISWKSMRKTERHIQTKKDIGNRFCKYESDLITPSKEHPVSLSEFEETGEQCPLPTKIVVLKPNLEEARTAERSVSSANSVERQPDRRQKLRFRGHKSFSEVSDSDLSENFEASRPKSKDSRKSSRERRNMKCSGTRSSNMLALEHMEQNGFDQNRSSLDRSEKGTPTDSEVLAWTSGHFDDWNSSQNPSSSYPAESSLAREARKLFSEQWTSQRSQDAGFNGRGPSTLREMLAFSSRETPNPIFLNEVQYIQGDPSDFSSLDDWKDRCPRNLSRSKSLPASSTILRSPELTDRRRDCIIEDSLLLKDVLNLASKKPPEGNDSNLKLNFRRKVKPCSSKSLTCKFEGEENEHPIWETSMNPNVKLNRSSTNRPALFEPSPARYYDAVAFIDDVSVSPNEETEVPSKLLEDELHHQQTDVTMESLGDGDLVRNDQNDMMSKKMSNDRPQVLSSLSHSFARQSEPSIPCSGALQPNQVSVLGSLQPYPFSAPEPPEEEESGPKCFERVNADLQGLRLKLQLLKQESAGTYEVSSEASSDEDSTGEITRTFIDDDDRDFLYLLDMLTVSGLLNTASNMIFAACYQPEYPVCLNVFEKLEMIYGQTGSSRAERKLLFDFANSVVSEFLVPNMDPHPWIKQGRRTGLTQGCKVSMEDIWPLLVRRRKELNNSNPADTILDEGWLYVRDDIDLLGRDLGNIIMDDLLDEAVSEFLFR